MPALHSLGDEGPRAGDNLLNPLLPQLAFGHALQCVLREMQFHFASNASAPQIQCRADSIAS
jgi:hypothetical protein